MGISPPSKAGWLFLLTQNLADIKTDTATPSLRGYEGIYYTIRETEESGAHFSRKPKGILGDKK